MTVTRTRMRRTAPSGREGVLARRHLADLPPTSSASPPILALTRVSCSLLVRGGARELSNGSEADAEGKYVSYRCTGFNGRCGNAYIRQEDLSDLLATTIDPIQIPLAIADSLEATLRTSQAHADAERLETKERLARQRRALIAKLDR